MICILFLIVCSLNLCASQAPNLEIFIEKGALDQIVNAVFLPNQQTITLTQELVDFAHQNYLNKDTKFYMSNCSHTDIVRALRAWGIAALIATEYKSQKFQNQLIRVPKG